MYNCTAFVPHFLVFCNYGRSLGAHVELMRYKDVYSQLFSDRPYIIIANCTVPAEPCNSAIVDYERLNETVSEGTVLTYQCDNGFSLTRPNTITCTNARVWSTEPEAIMCVGQ